MMKNHLGWTNVYWIQSVRNLRHELQIIPIVIFIDNLISNRIYWSLLRLTHVTTENVEKRT